MKSNTITPDTSIATDDVPSTAVFEAFSHRRRQYVLRYLVHKPGAIALGDLAEYIAIEEGATTRDGRGRVLTNLYHNHLPHLIDAGLVQYDVGRELVALRVDPEMLLPYLKLASPAASE